jgi:hypothetical protein
MCRRGVGLNPLKYIQGRESISIFHYFTNIKLTSKSLILITLNISININDVFLSSLIIFKVFKQNNNKSENNKPNRDSMYIIVYCNKNNINIL